MCPTNLLAREKFCSTRAPSWPKKFSERKYSVCHREKWSLCPHLKRKIPLCLKKFWRECQVAPSLASPVFGQKVQKTNSGKRNGQKRGAAWVRLNSGAFKRGGRNPQGLTGLPRFPCVNSPLGPQAG